MMIVTRACHCYKTAGKLHMERYFNKVTVLPKRGS